MNSPTIPETSKNDSETAAIISSESKIEVEGNDDELANSNPDNCNKMAISNWSETEKAKLEKEEIQLQKEAIKIGIKLSPTSTANKLEFTNRSEHQEQEVDQKDPEMILQESEVIQQNPDVNQQVQEVIQQDPEVEKQN